MRDLSEDPARLSTLDACSHDLKLRRRRLARSLRLAWTVGRLWRRGEGSARITSTQKDAEMPPVASSLLLVRRSPLSGHLVQSRRTSSLTEIARVRQTPVRALGHREKPASSHNLLFLSAVRALCSLARFCPTKQPAPVHVRWNVSTPAVRLFCGKKSVSRSEKLTLATGSRETNPPSSPHPRSLASLQTADRSLA
ncbi:hypothetical protein BJY59DRAFT_419022 [Rhodotorula toruloides]